MGGRRTFVGTASTVSRAIQQLETLNRSTEHHFLAVGDKLMEFRSSARQIVSDTAAVTEMISGERGRHASEALHRLLEHSQTMDAQVEENVQALACVRDFSSRLRKAFSGLANMVAVFRSLCTLTQIETARLGGVGADLGHLAAEIRPLTESIQSSGEGVLAASNRLNQAVQSAIRNGAELRNTQLKEIPVLIAGVLDTLQAFEQQQQRALETSGRQAAEYAAVCEAIDELVGSIQFHDITRQQVEHVLEALRQLRTRWQDRREKEGCSRDTCVILKLQSSQLAEAARLFAQSIERMEGALESISARLQNASQDARALMGFSTDDKNSFFLKMETQFSAILKMLGTCDTAQAEMESTVTGLVQTIGRMQNSVKEIRGTEIQIQRISTNATIRATHIGATGVALNKIAEVMQRMALESNTNTEEAAAALAAMSNASNGVFRSDLHGSTENPVAHEMQSALVDLHTSSESSASRVDHIAQLGAQLAQDINALRGGVSAGRMFAEVVGRVRSELEEIGAQAAEAALQDAATATQEHLEHLAKSYTMQRQRDVHESVLGTAAMPEAVAPAATTDVRGGSDLGDNVDLF